MALGNTANIDHLVLVKHGVNRDLLLKERSDEVNLISHGTTIDLKLGLLLLYEYRG